MHRHLEVSSRGMHVNIKCGISKVDGNTKDNAIIMKNQKVQRHDNELVVIEEKGKQDIQRIFIGSPKD